MSLKARKKQIVLDYFQAKGTRAFAEADLRAGRDELRRQLGAQDRTSLGYIASVLREGGYEVQYDDRYAGPAMPEPYATRLKGLLEFHDLASAERSILKLDALFREYASVGDPVGERLVFALVKRGKLRARSLAANPRVQIQKRQEKLEIARWFQVWLETPDLFARWVELRKSSEEFRRLFADLDPPG